MMERRARELQRVAGYWQGAGLILLVASFASDGWIKATAVWLCSVCLVIWGHVNGRAHGIREALKSGEGRASLPPERKD
jgi:hypothetical protein